MTTRNDDCDEVYSYFVHTNVGLGTTDRYIETISELSTFKDLMSNGSETNVELMLHSSLNREDAQVETLLSMIASYGYEVYSIGSVEYRYGTTTIEGKIYIITNLE